MIDRTHTKNNLSGMTTTIAALTRLEKQSSSNFESSFDGEMESNTLLKLNRSRRVTNFLFSSTRMTSVNFSRAN